MWGVAWILVPVQLNSSKLHAETVAAADETEPRAIGKTALTYRSYLRAGATSFRLDETPVLTIVRRLRQEFGAIRRRAGQGVNFRLLMLVCVGMAGLGLFTLHQGMGLLAGGTLLALGAFSAVAGYL